MEGEVSGGHGGGRRRRMKCERVGCEQGARSCRVGGDAMDFYCGGRTAKEVPPLPRRALFTLKRELVGVEGRLPQGPRLVGAGEAVPVRVFFGILPRRGVSRWRSRQATFRQWGASPGPTSSARPRDG